MSRIRRAHPQDEIGIVLDNCEKHVPAMRDRLIPALHYLFSRVGYPARRNHLCLYAGTYRSTPFGIHRDDCHVVMFSGVGKKAMAFWPRPYFDQKKDLFVGGKVARPPAGSPRRGHRSGDRPARCLVLVGRRLPRGGERHGRIPGRAERWDLPPWFERRGDDVARFPRRDHTRRGPGHSGPPRRAGGQALGPGPPHLTDGRVLRAVGAAAGDGEPAR